MSRKGLFIVLEGIDGSGTTTQAHKLEDWFRDSGYDVVCTYEPSNLFVGQLIRQILRGEITDVPSWETMALLFTADRMFHLEKIIIPAWNAGKVVICDRYYYSTIAYQSFTANVSHREAVAWLKELNGRAMIPDLTIVLDIGSKVALTRIGERGQKYELFEYADLQRKLAKFYRRLDSHVFPGNLFSHINGNCSKEVVFEEIKRAIQVDVFDKRNKSTRHFDKRH